MNLQQAIRTGFTKYVTFHGRATRTEFWYWQVFSILTFWALAGTVMLTDPRRGRTGAVVIIVIIALILLNLALVLPGIAVGARRLHDSNMSGWWQLIIFVPVVGGIAWIILATQRSGPTPNRFE